MKRLIIFLPLLLLSQGNLFADNFYVDARKGSNSTGDGSKEKPWFTISFALSKITGAGHAIQVAPGTYDTVMDGVFPEIFPLLIRSGISLIGVGADSTIIDAKASNTAMRFENTGSAQIKIEGFTIRGGKNSAGGGVFLQNSNVLVQHNLFDRNEQAAGSSGGGAITIESGTVVVIQNAFTNNKAGGSGGAITVGNGTVSIRQNQFIGNSAIFSGAAFYMRTGANVNVEIVENIFRANTVGFENEEIYIGSFLSQSSLSPLISRNIITSGIKCENSRPRIFNNTLVGAGSKTAIRIQNASPAISNNLITGWSNGILEANATSDPDTVAYNLFFNNTCLYYDENIRCLNTLTALEALTTEAAHNLAGDPKFVDAAKNDYRLLPGSPAIDAGDPNSPKDPDNTRTDIGALYFSPTPPAAPKNLQAATGDGRVTLIWTANTEADFLRYRIYGGTSPNPAAKIDSLEGLANTTKTITDLTNGTPYYFRITAVNTSLQESGFSNQASATPALFTDVSTVLARVKRSSVAWGDYDNDDDLDIFLTGDSEDTDDPENFLTKIYRNDDGTFVDATAPLPRVTYGALAWGDYDNDGDLDILLTGTTDSFAPGAIAKIYQNNNGNFVDAAANLQKVYVSAVAWGDYDNDGDLDILLTGRTNPQTVTISKIYRNNAGVFQDIQANLIGVERSSVAWGDYDNDGDLDILLSGRTRDQNPPAIITKIYSNENGLFSDINAPLPEVFDSSVSWGDYDNDGDLDLLITGETASNGLIARIYRNDNNAFVPTSIALAGVHKSSAKFGDYDNDGDLDILLTGDASQQTFAHTTKIYRNDNLNFSDIAVSLPGVSESSVAWGDFDNDNDLDILLTGANADPLGGIFRNNSSRANTVPAAPGGLAAAINGNSVTLNWNKATDNQTVSNALTYNLRVGKTPGGSEIVAPMANGATGYRRVVQLGHTNHRNSWTIKNLPDGTYFWSVQAIDNVFAGSAFAAEKTFTVQPQAVTLTSITPNTGNRLQTLDVLFTGTNFSSGVAVNTGAGITVNSVTVHSSMQLTANITIGVTAATGPRNFSVGASNSQSFTVNNPFPVLTSLNPNSGSIGQTLNVVFSGVNFFSDATTLNVGSGITVNTITVNGPTSLTANLTITNAALIGARDFRVSNSAPGGGTSNPFTFTVQPQTMTLTSLSPNNGNRLQTLNAVCTGTGFSSGVAVNVGAGITVNSTTVTSSTQLTTNLTIGTTAATGARNFSVGTSNNQTFTVNNPAPALTSISPANGNIGQTLEVVFTGANFFSDATTVNVGSSITVNSIAVTSMTSLTANITISASATTGARNFFVTNAAPGGGISTTQTFSVQPQTITLTSISPSSGNRLQTLNVIFTGTNFSSGLAVNVGSGLTVNSTVFNSSTQVTANLTISAAAATGVRDFSVGTSNSQTFMVSNPAPILTSINPATARVGQTLNVVFTGANFFSDATTVNVGNGIAINAVNVTSVTNLTANITIAANATTGSRNFSVTNAAPGGDVSTSQTFTVSGNTPPSLTHTATTLAQNGLAIPISANVTDDNGIASVQLNYRRGGATSFSIVTMNSTGGAGYQALIPASEVTARGVEYFILVTDVDSAKTRRPAAGSFSIQIQLSNASKPTAQPSGSAQTAFRLISVPLLLDNPSATAVLEDDLGPYNDVKWRLFGLAPVTSQEPNNKTPYVEFRSGGDLSPGKSLFLIVADPGKTITAGAAKSVQTDQEFQIPLQRGHNFIGNPFNFNIPVNKLRLQSGATITLWTYTGSFTPATELQPWEGYYLANLNQNTDVLFINPNLSTAMLSRAASPTGWRLQILASCGQARDNYNFAGVAATSNDHYDFNDLAEPPPIGDFVSLYFPHPEWQKALTHFSDDLRATAGENHEWRFHVATNIAREPVTLRFDGLQEIDPALDLWLVDDELKYKQNLRENATYQYLPRRADQANAFTLLVGKKEFVEEQTANAQGAPENFVLEQNFPNPFAVGAAYSLQQASTTLIRFGLPRTSVVTIKIFDVAGHEISILLDGAELPAGRHQRVWNGHDMQGRALPSGVYFYQLRGGGVFKTMKLLLLR